MDPTYPLAPIGNFLGVILALVPLLVVPNIRNAENISIHFFAVWISVTCLVHGVNEIIWKDNAYNSLPIWCDITTHIDVCAISAIPGCSLAIARCLYRLVSHKTHCFAYSRREVAIDCTLCLGLPLTSGILYYIVQGLRFEIFEELGCNYYVYPSGATILLVYFPSLLLCAVCLTCYLPALIWILISRRRKLSSLFKGNKVLNYKHYTRIIVMEIVVLVATITGVILMEMDLSGMAEIHVTFWPGWGVIHTDWQPMGFTTREWEQYSLNRFVIHWNEWRSPVVAYIFFAVYGLSNHARDRYALAFSTLWQLLTKLRVGNPPPEVIVLRSERSDSSLNVELSNTKPYIPSQDQMEIKFEQLVETDFNLSHRDIEKGQHTPSQESRDTEQSYSEI